MRSGEVLLTDMALYRRRRSIVWFLVSWILLNELIWAVEKAVEEAKWVIGGVRARSINGTWCGKFRIVLHLGISVSDVKTGRD